MFQNVVADYKADITNQINSNNKEAVDIIKDAMGKKGECILHFDQETMDRVNNLGKENDKLKKNLKLLNEIK